MKVTVTEEHIVKSETCRHESIETWRGLCTNCPMALALQDATGIADAWTSNDSYGLVSLTFEEPRPELPLPKGARQWIDQYDDWYNTRHSLMERDSKGGVTEKPTVPATFNF